MSTEPTTLELRRQLKRKMMRDFPLHSTNWSMPRLITDGNHDPKVKDARPKQHRAERDEDLEYSRFLRNPPPRGRHYRNAKHRGTPAPWTVAEPSLSVTREDLGLVS